MAVPGRFSPQERKIPAKTPDATREIDFVHNLEVKCYAGSESLGLLESTYGPSQKFDMLDILIVGGQFSTAFSAHDHQRRRGPRFSEGGEPLTANPEYASSEVQLRVQETC